MADLMNIVRPNVRNIGGGGNLNNELILIQKDDVVLPLPVRDEATGVITADIQMKAGKKMHTVYTTERTMEPTFTKQEGSNMDCFGYEVSLLGFHPGLEASILQFLDVHGDFRGFVVFRSVRPDGTEVRYLLGESYNPVSLSAAEFSWGKTGNEDRGTKITFKGTQNGPYAIYEGALMLQEDVVVAADATAIAYAGEAKYVLTAGTTAQATIAGISGMKHGEVIHIEGAAGEKPAKIAADEVFILKDSADFVASAGAWIALKAFSVGSNKMQFIEQSRGK